MGERVVAIRPPPGALTGASRRRIEILMLDEPGMGQIWRIPLLTRSSHRAALIETELRQAGVLRLSLFGSVARGEAQTESDVDLCAELDPRAHVGLFRLTALERRLSEILGRKVDLLPETVERPGLQGGIDRDRRRAF